MLKIVTTSQRKQLVVTTTLFNNNNKNKTKSTVFNGETVDAMIYQTFSIRSKKAELPTVRSGKKTHSKELMILNILRNISKIIFQDFKVTICVFITF
jgi:hypothetical protein